MLLENLLDHALRGVGQERSLARAGMQWQQLVDFEGVRQRMGGAHLFEADCMQSGSNRQNGGLRGALHEGLKH